MLRDHGKCPFVFGESMCSICSAQEISCPQVRYDAAIIFKSKCLLETTRQQLREIQASELFCQYLVDILKF